MSSPTSPTKEPSASTSAPAQPDRGPWMTGAEVLVRCLELEGVELIFAYPGGASMPTHQALTKSKTIRTVLPRHEQGGGFAAEGYARVTGKAGVCMSTSGPGATNVVTPIADAYLDSTPLVVISGQVPTFMIGRGAFQETDFFGVTLPIVKHSYLVTDAHDIPRIVKEAFYIAQTGRPGPVIIDLPKDVQEARIQPVFPEEIDLRGYNPHLTLDESAIDEALGLIQQAKRPVIYCGGGIISGEAHAELLEFAERTQIPVTTTLMGVGGFPESHPLSLKWLGMHGTVFANNAANEADLLLALGVRFDDRVTGKVEKFCEHGTIIHIDIDNSEINKNKMVRLPIQADIGAALKRLNELLAKAGCERVKTGFTRCPEWHAQIAEWKQQHPMTYDDCPDCIAPQYVISKLYELSGGDIIMTTGVGQHQMWAAQHYHFDKPRRLVTSLGLGSMGYGLPAALGAKCAFPDLEVVDIDGDGSFLMNVQELATAVAEGIAIKAVILNNQHLGMVVQWEDLKFQSNRAHTFLGKLHAPTDTYPDFVKMCASFDVTCEHITKKEEVEPALRRMLAAKEPYVLDIMVPYTEHVLPMIPGGMTYKDIITTSEGVRKASQGAVPTAL
ncbi:MAG: biosynthetic-type acetolactate synthase large subunit [Verrucomicrobiales bacterium]|nr:biosynthetic-type acetolactate synthase large subunit [Verrucomicrobiales bacterium]